MVPMLLAVAAAAFVVVIVGLVLLFRHPRRDDINSVRHYHAALGTLEHFAEQADRSGLATSPVPDDVHPDQTEAPPPSTPEAAWSEERSGVFNVTGGSPPGRLTTGQTPTGQRFYRRPDAFAPDVPDAGDRGPDGTRGAGGIVRPEPVRPTSSGRVPPVPVRGNRSLPDPGAPLVFDDSTFGAGPSTAVPGPTHAPRLDRAQRHALESMNRGPRRGSAIAAVLVVLIVLAALAYFGSRRSNAHHPTGHQRAAATTPSTAARHIAPPTTKAPHRSTSTTTTAPPGITASTSTPTTGTFAVPSPTYQLTVTATTGPCWVDATSLASGSTLWTGTVQAGQNQVIPATGNSQIELGSPTVSMMVGQAPVVFPSSFHAPYVATFTVPGSSAAANSPSGGATSAAGANGSGP